MWITINGWFRGGFSVIFAFDDDHKMYVAGGGWLYTYHGLPNNMHVGKILF